ncbi:ComEC/Rec2 family competence protein [Ruegeria arenilitoris]|uniref:ComEC/Rec2 family competence protein n=1 Tax=Ruegeria arenilitoris TaxID=1173585 RepID=UPI00147E6A80|nr:ComEC/Rec2 family competence protein [Ruegeria arenilitoris]
MRVLALVEAAMLRQRGHLIVWSPICVATGIGLYFSLRFEPDVHVYAQLVSAIFLGAFCSWKLPTAWSPVAIGVALIAFGFLLAGGRAHLVSEPVLKWRYYGPIEGRVVSLDRSASDALRVTLDQVRIEGVPVDERPRRVRISMHGPATNLLPGQRIMTTGHLSAPQGPVEPGGFDFRRHAWFQRLGAVGYTRVPVLTIAPASAANGGVPVTYWRISISNHVQNLLPGEVGGFAAAVTTGDRSGLRSDTLLSLRASNLAHLLAISGLHMGLLTGFVFLACRVGFSAVPAAALRLPVKKLAAVCAMVSATIYFLLSGGNIATERAFVMVLVMFGALLLDRRAISLRAVAVAALIVLAMRPESLLGPGFQMSFAATTALVAVFGALRNQDLVSGPKWLKQFIGLILSSAIAGFATAPIGAAHFNTMSHFGLLANLLSVPVMGAIVVPAAVLSAFLAPVGLEWVALTVMGIGLKWILGVSEWVSGLHGAQGYVMSPPDFVLPALSLSILWVILWQGRARWAGLVPAMAVMTLWGQGTRPDVLVAGNGGLIGVMTENGRALSKSKGNGFVASVWLENDGDGADQKLAAKRWPGEPGLVQRYQTEGLEIVHLTGKRAAQDFNECRPDQIVVSPVALQLSGGCRLYDSEKLENTGSLALSKGRLVTSNEASGRRLWSLGYSGQ